MENVLLIINQNELSGLNSNSFKGFRHFKTIQNLHLVVRKQSSYLGELDQFVSDYKEESLDFSVQYILKHLDENIESLKKFSYDLVNLDNYSDFFENYTPIEYDTLITWPTSDRLIKKLISRIPIPVLMMPVSPSKIHRSFMYLTEKPDLPNSSLQYLKENTDPYLDSPLNILHYYKDSQWYLRETVYTTDEVQALLDNRSVIDKKISSILEYRKEQLLLSGLSLNRDVNVNTIKREVHNTLEDQLIREINLQRPGMIILDSEVFSMSSRTLKLLMNSGADYFVFYFPKDKISKPSSTLLGRVFESLVA